MTTEITAAPTTVPVAARPRFGSLSAMRAAHQQLLKAAAVQPPADGLRERILAFLAAGTHAGAAIESGTDRAAAQALLDYWVGVLYSALGTGDGKPGHSVPDAVLADFVPATLSDLVAVAESAYRRLTSDEDRRLTRAVFLEFARPAAGGGVVNRPVRRETLYRLGEPAVIDRILAPWVAAGVVAETKAAEPEDDRLELTHKGLARDWPVLAGWLTELRRHEEKGLQLAATARLWKESGKEGYLLTGSALDEAIRYAEPGSDMEALVKASREGQDRSTRRKTVIRRIAIAVLSSLCIALTLASWLAWENANRYKFQQKRVRMVQVVRAVAEIGAARTKWWRDLAIKRLKALLKEISNDRHGGDQFFKAVIEPISSVDIQVAEHRTRAEPAANFYAADAWKAFTSKLFQGTDAWTEFQSNSFYTTDTWKDLNIELAYKVSFWFRNTLLDDDYDRAQDELKLIRRIAYDRVEYCVGQMLEIFEKESFDTATPYVREFWLNHWGDFKLVAGGSVKEAMRNFGGKLSNIEKRLPAVALEDDLKSLLKNVGERDAWLSFSRELVGSIGSIARFSRLFRKYSRMAYPEEIAELHDFAEKLYKALDEERTKNQSIEKVDLSKR